jgi:hypothetical protein
MSALVIDGDWTDRDEWAHVCALARVSRTRLVKLTEFVCDI